MKNIIWLASYPKSGNTWFRSFITAILNNGVVDINKMDTDGIFSGKNVIENQLDLCSDDLHQHEIERFQRLAYTASSQAKYELMVKKDKSRLSPAQIQRREKKEKLFIKVHDAYTYSEWDGEPIIPTDPSFLAIYLIRNPLDVTLSLANHSGTGVDQTIKAFLSSPTGAFVKKNRSNNQFKQLMGTWQMHAQSWIEQKHIPVHIIRYEDMLEKPFETFKSAMTAMNIEANDDEIKAAINATTFEKLSSQEKEADFKEKPRPSGSFFFKGSSGRWKTELSSKQVEAVCAVNSIYMKKFGYWPDSNE